MLGGRERERERERDRREFPHLPTRSSIRPGAEKLDLKIPSVVNKNLEGAPETREEIIGSRRGGNISRLEVKGDAFHPLGELVHHHQDVLITLCSTGQGSRKSRCTLSMGAPERYLSISALACR